MAAIKDESSATINLGPELAFMADESEESESDMFRAGEIVRARYRVDRLIGKGGMGEVYQVHDLRTDDQLALKTVLRERVGNDKVVARFQQEAELSRRVSHPNVLQIYDVFEVRKAGFVEPVPCMVMEYLDGSTLADRLEVEKRLTVEGALPIVCQMATALAASHRAGVVHRDLKPDNVFLVPEKDGEPRAVLTDFGVARTTPTEVGGMESDSLTATNVILGTPFYMAPEQLELETATPATDIYTFGLVIYEMVTGTLPFLAQSTLQTVFRRVREDPASPREHRPDLDVAWEQTILRCLAREPANRFGNAEEICAALSGSEVEPGSSVAEPVPPSFVALIVGGVLVVALVIWLIMQ